MLFLFVKHLHVAMVAVSLGGFAARGALMLAGSRLLDARWVRVAPHVVDTVLLASGIWLAWLTAQSPLAQPWLAAKILGLCAYIGFGMLALRRARTKAARAICFVLALAAAAYIVSVALTRDPAGWLGLMRRPVA
jgi:uncharacterized membrane protein SirB2